MRILVPLLAGLAVAATPASAMSPEEAYAAIPHQRTTFDTRASAASASQAESLQRLFTLSDQGVILKVEGMRAQRARNVAEVKRVLAAYDGLVDNLQRQPFAAEVVPARDLIVKALRDHRRYMASRPEGGMTFVRNELTSAPAVTQASASLQRAYGLLMKAFPGEPARNKAAFYDYLCALDYL
jgi:hypothetical protein